MTSYIMPMKAYHYDGMSKIRNIDLKSLTGLGDIKAIVEYYEKAGPAVSYFVNGQIIAMIGMVELWRGVAEIWMLTTDHVENNKLFFYKQTLNLMKKYSDKLHRIQCVTHIDNERSEKWLVRMGFKFEGIMKSYGADKADYKRFAWLS